MRQQVIDMAGSPTNTERLAVIEGFLHRTATVPTAEQIVADVAAEW